MDKELFNAMVAYIYRHDPTAGDLHLVLDNLSVDNHGILSCLNRINQHQQDDADFSIEAFIMENVNTLCLTMLQDVDSLDERVKYIQEAKDGITT